MSLIDWERAWKRLRATQIDVAVSKYGLRVVAVLDPSVRAGEVRSLVDKWSRTCDGSHKENPPDDLTTV